MISMRLNKMLVPALSAGLMMGVAGASQAQFFNYNNVFNGATYPTTVTITTTSAADTLTVTPGQNANGTLAPSLASAFTLTPNSTATSGTPAATTTTTTFTDTFQLQRTSDLLGTIFPGAAVASFSFTGTISGTLGPDNDNTVITVNPFAPVILTSGGQSFIVSFDSFRNPGPPNTSANTGGVTLRVTAVPEPGSVAMLVGMGISGAGFLVRKRRSK